MGVGPEIMVIHTETTEGHKPEADMIERRIWTFILVKSVTNHAHEIQVV
jgi:hypothetical protein